MGPAKGLYYRARSRAHPLPYGGTLVSPPSKDNSSSLKSSHSSRIVPNLTMEFFTGHDKQVRAGQRATRRRVQRRRRRRRLIVHVRSIAFFCYIISTHGPAYIPSAPEYNQIVLCRQNNLLKSQIQSTHFLTHLSSLSFTL